MGNPAAMGIRSTPNDLIPEDRDRMFRAGFGGGAEASPTTPGLVTNMVQPMQTFGTAPYSRGMVGGRGMAGGVMPDPRAPAPAPAPVTAPVPGTPVSTIVGAPARPTTKGGAAKKKVAETGPYERWKQLGRPGGSFDAWKASQGI